MNETSIDNLENQLSHCTITQINKLEDIKLPENKFLVISKSNCVFCEKACYLLNMKGISYEYINVDNLLVTQKAKNQFLEYMCELISYEYDKLPMIFYNKQFIGGYNNLEEYFKTKNNLFV